MKHLTNSITSQCQGVLTTADVPKHMGAAARIMLQVLQQSEAPRRYLDAVRVEAVLFHAFHTCTGLWSDTSEGPDYGFDASLWKKAETYLGEDSSELSLTSQGPVLGVPTSLLRLAIQLRQVYRSPLLFTLTELARLKEEVALWENKLLFHIEEPRLLSEQTGNIARDRSCRDISALYALAVSLLLDNISHQAGFSQWQVSSVVRQSWQLKMAVDILQKHEADQSWQRSYMGNWPVYTLGSFAPSTAFREVMRNDLLRRWKLTRMGQSRRFLDDMQKMWDSQDKHGQI